MKSIRSGVISLLPCLALGIFPVSPLSAQDSPPESADSAGASTAGVAEGGSAVDRAVARAESDRQLRFNFQGTGWGAVLDWFADEADLSLQIDQVPQGTVNFVDPERTYSVREGLDLLNRLLLSRGWALVRDGRMLRIIDLEAENAAKLIRETAELVTPQQFAERGDSDIVTCIFPLGGIDPSNAREELAEMIGPWGDLVVLDSARRVKVTETVAKLRAIQEVLESATKTVAGVVTISLRHRTAEEVLELARPLLGLEAGANANDDIRISVTLYGDRIFATGLPAKLALLQQIITEADEPLEAADPDAAGEVARPELVTHSVTTADIDTVFQVLQTMLAGLPEVRLAVDPKTNAIVASARPENQQLIRDTIAELEGRGTSFEIINLKRLEPSQALLTINKFFGVSDEGGKGPTVDGDPVSGRLWVRGTPDEIATVKKLLAELEGDDGLGALGERIRILPYTGRAAEEAVSRLETLWGMTGRTNRIRTVSPSRGVSGGGLPERRLRANPPTGESQPSAGVPRTGPEDSRESEASRPEPSRPLGPPDARHWPTDRQHRFVAAPQDAGTATEDPPGETIRFQGADIIVQMTPSGLVVASEDAEALDAFETLMQSLAAPSGMQSELPTIYWLKYIKADLAAELVSNILGGAESSAGSIADSVIGGLGGGMLGGLLGMGGGGNDSGTRSILTASGSVNIIPDARLNALFVQANPIDLEFIDLILEKIDVQESPEEVETIARPALIPVIYQDAKEVAELVKAVYAEKIAGQGGNQGRGGGGGGQGGFSPQDFIAALREGGGGRGGRGGRGGGGGGVQSEPAKITVAVDTRSNSLVVTATPYDFEEIRRLVNTLDQQGMETEEGIAVVAIPGAVKPDVVKQALESMLGRKPETASAATNRGDAARGGDAGRGGGDAGAPSPDELRRRIEFFRSLREGGGGTRGGFGGRGGGPPGGGPPGGGGRF